MKIAAAQIDCAVGEIETNLGKIRDFVSRAKDRAIDLIVFPEMSDIGYSMPVIQKQATPWKEGAVPELKKMAKEFSLAIVCGVSERAENSIYNSQVMIDRVAKSSRPTEKLICSRQLRSRNTNVFRPAINLVMSHMAICISASAFVTTFAFLNFIALWPAIAA